jgi:hypothetical protein
MVVIIVVCPSVFTVVMVVVMMEAVEDGPESIELEPVIISVDDGEGPLLDVGRGETEATVCRTEYVLLASNEFFHSRFETSKT